MFEYFWAIIPEVLRITAIPVARVVRRTRPEIGNTVCIKNPRSFQRDSGIDIGFMRTGFVVVQTPNGDEVKKISRNLEIID